MPENEMSLYDLISDLPDGTVFTDKQGELYIKATYEGQPAFHQRDGMGGFYGEALKAVPSDIFKPVQNFCRVKHEELYNRLQAMHITLSQLGFGRALELYMIQDPKTMEMAKATVFLGLRSHRHRSKLIDSITAHLQDPHKDEETLRRSCTWVYAYLLMLFATTFSGDDK